MIIGLTGGIASGKSTVSKYLAEKGFKVYDADKIAKDISEKKLVQEEIILTFGNKILDENRNILSIRPKIFLTGGIIIPATTPAIEILIIMLSVESTVMRKLSGSTAEKAEVRFTASFTIAVNCKIANK